MGMNNRLLRPLNTAIQAVIVYFMTTISGDSLVTIQDGDNLTPI